MTRPFLNILPTIFLPLANRPPIFLQLARSWISCQPCSYHSPVPEEPASYVPTTCPFLNILPTMFLPFVCSWGTSQLCSYYSPTPEYATKHDWPVPEYPADHVPDTRLLLRNRSAMFLPLACSWRTSQLCSYNLPITEYLADHISTTHLFLRYQPAMFLRLAFFEYDTNHDWPVPEYPADHISTTQLFLRYQPAMFLRLAFFWIWYQPCSMHSNDWPVPDCPADHVPITRLFLRNQTAMFLLLNMLPVLNMTELFLNILPTMFLPFALCRWLQLAQLAKGKKSRP
jgi:hypothetical protein